MIQDRFVKMVHCDVRFSKAPPVSFINDFPSAEATQKPCAAGPDFGSQQMLKLFKKHNCVVLLTAPDASNQNPVEHHHQTISNAVRAMLIGTNPLTKFWPCVLHAVQTFKSLPPQGQTTSPVESTTKRKEDLNCLRAFGCRGWVQPPGVRPAKFGSMVQKGIFLGCTPTTARDFLWCDCRASKVKITQ